MVRKNLCLVIGGLVLAGCSGTTVVLVPDPDGKVGRVSVTTSGGQETLSKAGESTRASDAKKAPESPKLLSDEKIKDIFRDALGNEPTPPERRQIYFPSGSAELQPDTAQILKAIHQSIQSRKSCDISVIGHSDRAGDDALNQELSLKRAKIVVDALQSLGVESRCMTIRYYGENDPIIPTADGVAEPRNRRVEVEIR